MNKLATIIDGLSRLGELSLTVGYSEELPNKCVCILRNENLLNRTSKSLSNIKSNKSLGEAFTVEDKIAGLLCCLGDYIRTPVLLTLHNDLDVDCLLLFNDIDLIKEINELQKGENKWHRIS